MNKVIHLSNSDLNGGAARGAFRLHQAMKREGIQSSMLVQQRLSSDKDVFHLSSFDDTILRKLRKKLDLFKTRKVNKSRGIFSYPILSAPLANHPLVVDADIIYLHWVNNSLITVREVEKILELGKPTIWFMRDMWPMTGGCHYSFECEGFQKSCGNCPYMGSNNSKDLSYDLLQEKIRRLSKFKNLIPAGPSTWICALAEKSTLFRGKKAHPIPNAMPSEFLDLECKAPFRRMLGIPENKTVIGFGADGGGNNPYKGYQYLQATLKILAASGRSDFHLVVFGGKKPSVDEFDISATYTGHLGDDISLSSVYQTLDVFAFPTLADNLPSTVLESAYCGVPVASFHVGGVPDMVEHMKTGYLAKPADAEDLARGILWCIDQNQDRTLSKNSIAKMKHEFSNIAKRHQDLWKSLES